MACLLDGVTACPGGWGEHELPSGDTWARAAPALLAGAFLGLGAFTQILGGSYSSPKGSPGNRHQ